MNNKNKQAWFILSLAAVVALTLVSGVLQGHIRNRWGPSEAMRAAAQRLEDVPSQFGGPQNDRWRMQSSETMDQVSVEMLECAGYIVRTYANRRTGETVNIFVIVGPTGPTAVHTPEVCYSSREFKIRDQREQVAITGAEGQEDQFWGLTFKSNRLRGDLLRVYYAWSTGDHWSATKGPRYEFVGRPYLYKIQLAANLPEGTDPGPSETCRQFLKDFVPVLQKYLISNKPGYLFRRSRTEK
jgi:hypothetical protein